MRNFKLNPVALLFAFLLMMGCGGEEQKKSTSEQSKEDSQEKVSPKEKKALENIKQMEEEAMVIHDEIMPEMDSLRQLRKQLEKKLKESTSGAQEEKLQRAINDLAVAEEKMMSWMNKWTKEYKPATDTLSLDLRKQKVDSLYLEVEKLREEWRKSLEKASSIVAEN